MHSRRFATGAAALLLAAAGASAQDSPTSPRSADTTDEIAGKPTPGAEVTRRPVEGPVDGVTPADLEQVPGEPRAPADTTDDIAGKPTPEEPIGKVVDAPDCTGYGNGFSTIPGTSTCLRVGGYVRFDSGFGDLNGADTNDPANGGADTWSQSVRFAFNTYTSAETPLGRLNTFTETRFTYGDTVATNDLDVENPDGNGVAPRGSTTDTSLNFAWIELGGFRAGKGETLFDTFVDYAGAVINDTTIGGYGFFDTDFVQYTYAPEDGAVSAAIGFENGANDYLIDDYVPHVVLAVGTKAGPGVARLALALDTRDGEDVNGDGLGGYSVDLRGDVEFSPTASVFLMGLYGENSSAYTTWATGNPNDDTPSVIAGHTATINDRLVSNSQLQWVRNNAAGDDLYNVVANVAYEIVPGVAITPELQWRHDAAGGDDFGGVLRAQASF